MNIHILNFNEWINESLKRSLSGNNIHEKRFIDTCLELNEDTQVYFQLDEERKNLLDDLIVEKTLEYIDLDGKLYEGFWGKFKDWAKEVGGKAADLAKNIVGKIGEFVKGVKEAVKKIFRYAVSMGKHYAHEKAESMVSRHKEHGKKPEGDPKEDGKLFMDHLHFTCDKAFGNYADRKSDAAKSEVQQELKSNENENQLYVLSLSMVEVINDFKNVDLWTKLNEEEVTHEAKPEDLDKETMEKNVFFKVVQKIVNICTTGLAQMLEHVFKKGNEKVLEYWTSVNNKLGGPAKNPLSAIAALGAFALVTILEIGSSVLKKFVLPGSGVVTSLYYAVHATSVMGLVNLILYSLVHNSILYWIVLGVSVVMSTYLLLKELGIVEKSEEIEKEETQLNNYEKVASKLETT